MPNQTNIYGPKKLQFQENTQPHHTRETAADVYEANHCISAENQKAFLIVETREWKICCKNNLISFLNGWSLSLS